MRSGIFNYSPVGAVSITEVQCVGNETRLDQCLFREVSINCSDSGYVGVFCDTGNFQPGPIGGGGGGFPPVVSSQNHTLWLSTLLAST